MNGVRRRIGRGRSRRSFCGRRRWTGTAFQRADLCVGFQVEVVELADVNRNANPDDVDIDDLEQRRTGCDRLPRPRAEISQQTVIWRRDVQRCDLALLRIERKCVERLLPGNGSFMFFLRDVERCLAFIDRPFGSRHVPQQLLCKIQPDERGVNLRLRLFDVTDRDDASRQQRHTDVRHLHTFRGVGHVTHGGSRGTNEKITWPANNFSPDPGTFPLFGGPSVPFSGAVTTMVLPTGTMTSPPQRAVPADGSAFNLRR